VEIEASADRFEFFHTWFPEFLAARYIMRRGKDVIRRLSEPPLKSCVPYAIGLVEDVHRAFSVLNSIPVRDPYSYCRAVSEKDFELEQRCKLLRNVIDCFEKSKKPTRVETSQALVEAGSSSLDALYSILKGGRCSYERRAALEAISTLETNEDKLDRVLLDLLASETEDLLWHVIEHVGIRKLGKSSQCLKRIAHNTVDPIAAGDAVWALAEIAENSKRRPSPRLKRALRAYLKLSRGHPQGHALRTIARLRIKEALPEVIAHFNDRDKEFRWLAYEAIVDIEESKGIEYVHTALADEDARVVGTALNCIAEKGMSFPKDEIEPALGNLSEDEKRVFMRQTIGSLAKRALDRLASSDEQGRLTTIYVARHCSTSWSEVRKLQGRQPTELSETGKTEARSNVKVLRGYHITKIITSPALRAQQTARIYAERLHVPIEIRFRLVPHFTNSKTNPPLLRRPEACRCMSTCKVWPNTRRDSR
jgi:hypothetical protein